MTKLSFCRSFVYLQKQLITFDRRPYLPAIYAARRNLVLRCSRQTEKSTFLVNTILYEAWCRPGTQILFVCPRMEQARTFANLRLIPALQNSPVIRRALIGGKSKLQIMNMHFRNGSAVSIRAAFHSGDACRGLSADLLLVDEFQDMAAGDLPVLQETLSHAKHGRTILTGTPKSVDNHLEAMYRRSTANEWTIDCPECHKGAILNELSIGPRSVICPACAAPLDVSTGRWVARNPDATWGDGYWVCHPMVPWLGFDAILQRQRDYDIPKFKNEVLGLSTMTGDHVVTRAELEACCRPNEMAKSRKDIPTKYRPRLVAGIDWGNGGVARTVLVIGYMSDDFKFQACFFQRFPAEEEPDVQIKKIAQKCLSFGVRLVAADGNGHGHVLNCLLVDKLGLHQGLYGILYGKVDHPPYCDGVLWKWPVNRSAAIGAVFTRVKQEKILFPQLSQAGTYLDELACEVAEYDDINRTIKYAHPQSQQDDALHAVNYALLLAVRQFNNSPSDG